MKTKAYTTKTLTVVAAGPDPDFDGTDEIPVWYVAIEDDDGDPVGKTYTLRSRAAAVALAVKMARDRGLDIVNDTMPA
jgi:hypothetical protein